MKENKIITAGYFVVAYLFGYVMHLYWVEWASHYPQFFWNGQLMINNVDGYFFASDAQKILSGMHMDNPRLLDTYHYGVAVLSAYIVKFFPFLNLDTVILYLPPVISSIVVIPIILIGKLYNNIKWGFLASLIAVIGWSYYNRTLAGYYDTDMFSAMLPMFILYFLLAAVKRNSLAHTVLASLFIIIYPFLYGQGLSIIYGMGIMAFLYLIVYSFKEKFTYQFIILVAIALMPIDYLFRIIALFAFYFLFDKKSISIKNLQIVAGISFLLFFITGNVFGIIMAKILSYSTTNNIQDGLKFVNVTTTVSEATRIPWYIVFDRIIGSGIGFIMAIVGYILLLRKYKEFIIALPLWGIGFFAFIGGLRFTVYAVAIASISAVYFFVWLSIQLKDKKSKYAVLVGGSLFVLLPNITHIVGCCQNSIFLSMFEKMYPLKSAPYLTPTTFNKNEVEILHKFKKLTNPKDYVISWWDYGYPIWYYSNVNTLIDGGKHNEDNFIVSKIMTTESPLLAHNLAKLSIKTYVDTNKTVATQIFTKNKKPVNVNDYLDKLSNKKDNIKLNRDLFLMMPYRMFDILPTIAYFSNRDINTGNRYKSHFFYKSRIYPKGNILMIGRFPLDLSTATIKAGNNKIPIKEVDIVRYDKTEKLLFKKQRLRNEGLNVIIMDSYREAIICDDYYYNSMFIQMFVFQNYDKKLFQPVILNPFMKIYKIK